MRHKKFPRHMFIIVFFLLSSFSCSEALVNKNYKKEKKVVLKKNASSDDYYNSCLKTFATIKSSKLEDQLIKNVCRLTNKRNDECVSINGKELFHFEKLSDKNSARKVLVFAAFHGDETEGAIVASHWIERLEKIDSRNSWRILPIMNPDGASLKTRQNQNGVDINRNFPTKDWKDLALKYWKNKTNSNKRRYPGVSGGSESETQCAISHVEDFKPDLVIAIHTPYGLLDFDGPQISFPKFAHLRWRKLGTFPGSLGRYMWVDRNIPVLTVELSASAKLLEDIDKIYSLQDLSGMIAIQSSNYLEKI